MPRYVSPSPTPPPRSRSRTKSSRSRTRSRSRSRQSRKSFSESTKEVSLVKTSLVFLGSIVAATFCAHKFWPKGVTYGEKEAWEVAEMKRVKKNLQEERRAGRRGIAYDFDDDRDRYGERGGERRRYSDRDGRRRSYYHHEDEVARPRGEERYERYERRADRERYDRNPERERYYYTDGGRYTERERYSDRGSERGSSRDRFNDGIDRRGSRREAYYPPAPQRYAVGSVDGYSGRAPSTRSRQSSRERKKQTKTNENNEGNPRQPGRYNDDEPEYLYGAAWEGGDGGPAGSHDRGGGSQDRGPGRSMSRDSADS